MDLNLLSVGWRSLSSNKVLRQLDVSYNRFYRHPLYRRWSIHAYEHPMAALAEKLPEKIGEVLTMSIVGIPLLALAVQVLFGSSMFAVLTAMLGAAVLVTVLVVSVLALALGALLAAMSVAQERGAGRWDLIMILPDDRSNLMLMRISSIIYPYRPFLITIEVLQNVIALLAVAIVGVAVDNNEQMMSLCLLYFLPSLFVLSWERRQDYALSLMVGGLVGVVYDGRRAFSMALVGTGLLVSLRMMVVLAAFGAGGTSTEFSAVIPALIGGPALIPMIGVQPWAALGFMLFYYAAREALISAVWRTTIWQMQDS